MLSKQKLVEKKSAETEILANRYQIQCKLGSGSFGTVFKVCDLKQDNEIKVVKEIPIGDLQENEKNSVSDEALLLSKLDHPGIVKFHDSFVENRHFYIVTEYCEGGDLDIKICSWKKKGTRLDESYVVRWTVQLLLAVQYMHKQRVLHRDLKTRNIFVRNTALKIGDFGISRLLQGTADIATTFTGTPFYMSPEQIQHHGYNSKSDIWSLGVIIFELCALEKPFQGSNLMNVMYSIVDSSIPRLPHKYSFGLQDIVSKMLCKDPCKRPSAYALLKEDFIRDHVSFLKVPSTLPRSKPPPGSTPPPPKQSVRPKTPRERLAERKLRQAEDKASRLQRITKREYAENRNKRQELKMRQQQVDPCLPASVAVNRVETIGKNNNSNSKKCSKSSQNGDKDAAEDIVNCNDSGTFEEDIEERKPKDYTQCFGEDSLPDDSLEDSCVKTYTHCFDEGDFQSENETINNISECVNINKNEKSPNNSDTNNIFCKNGPCAPDDSFERLCNEYGELVKEIDDITLDESVPNEEQNSAVYGNLNTSYIPSDETHAEILYTSYDDFEAAETSSSSSSGGSCSEDEVPESPEYNQLISCMQEALVSSLDSEDSLKDGSSQMCTKENRISTLRRQCKRVYGAQTFQCIYAYLSHARLIEKESEGVVMNQLKKLTDNTRDCFLIDQLLFLENQQIDEL